MKFFHTLDDNGNIDKQGVVLRRRKGKTTVAFFSWIDGSMSDQQETFGSAEVKTWRFYRSQTEWLRHGDATFAVGGEVGVGTRAFLMGFGG